MSDRYLKLWALVVVLGFLVATLALAWQAQYFSVDASADTLLMEDNKHYLETQKVAERYSPSEFILIAFAPRSERIYSGESLNTVAKVSGEIAQIERVEEVRSLVNVPLFAAVDSLSPDLKVESLSWEKKAYSEDTLKRVLKEHPLYKGLLVNRDDSALSMQVVFRTPDKVKQLDSQILELKEKRFESSLNKQEKNKLATLKEQRQALLQELDKTRSREIEKIRAIVKGYESEGEFYLGGGNLLAYELKQIIQSDLLIFGIVIVVIVSLVLLYLFRKLRWVLLPILCCGVSVIFTLGLLATFGLKVTVISTNVIALQIILTLAVIIHLIVQYQENMVNNIAESQVEAVLTTVKQKFKPCVYSALTTSVGFGSLVLSGIMPVISFGWMMVIALLITVIVALVFFPAALIFFSLDRNVTQHRYIESFMHWMADRVANKGGMVIVLTLVVSGAGLLGCFRLSAENSFINYFAESTDVYRELSYIDKNFGGSTPLDIIYSIPEDKQKQDVVLTADAITVAGKIREFLEEQEAIGSITSIEDFSRVAAVVNGKPLTEYELSAFYRTLDASLKNQLFGSWFSEQHNELRISTRVQDTTEGLDRERLMRELRKGIENTGVAPEDYKLTNLFVLYQDILDRLIQSQLLTTGVVYAAMALILLIIFGSMKIALISLVPNAVTTVTVIGVMGLFGISLDLMTMTIAAVAMGISMDDTIHYVHRYRQEARRDSSNAIHRTHLSVGYALLYTTAIILIGFMSLIFSEFVPSILFGALTSLAMFVALLTDITILPVLLKRFS